MLMKGTLPFLLFVLLAPQLAHAADNETKLLGSAVINADLQWEISLPDRLPNEVTFQSYAFAEEPYQHVESFSCELCKQDKDALANNLIKFTFQPVSTTELLNEKVQVSVDYQKGFREAVPGEESKFLSETKYVKLSDEIRTKAASIAGDGNDFDKIVRLAEWVHNAVTYEGLGYRDVILDSTQVYAVRAGKCSEFSHLFIAMARAVGIPAKFVAGFVYSGKEWGQHAWAEALADGKWIPVDPTFNEAGFLNAGHIKFAEDVDQENVKQQISAKGMAGEFPADAIKPKYSIDFASQSQYAQKISLFLSVPNETVGEGSLETIVATVKNLDGELATPLSINMPKDVKIASDEDRLLHLKPGEEASAEWKVVFPATLESGSIYNYTVEVLGLGKKATAYITAKKGGKATLEQSLEIKDLHSTQSDDSVTVFITIRNTGSLAFPSVVLSTTIAAAEQHRSFSIQPGEQKEFQLVFDKPAAPAAEGAIKITAAGKELEQPFVINLLQQQPSARPAFLSLSFGDQKVDVTMEEALAGGLAAVFLIALIAIIFRKPKKQYAETA